MAEWAWSFQFGRNWIEIDEGVGDPLWTGLRPYGTVFRKTGCENRENKFERCPIQLEDKMHNRASFSSAIILTAAMALPSFADSQSEKVEEIENSPVNCETAEQDLQLLAAERERAENSTATSLTALSPVGAMIGMAKGTQDEKLEILSGDYIEKIDQKTAEIKATCNL